MNSDDRRILRALAAHVRRIADNPRMRDLREQWCEHNSLRTSRPMVICSPEGAWSECVPQATLQCHDELAREWEMQLRRKIHTAEVLRDDQPIEPFLELSWNITKGDMGVEIPYHHGENRGSYVWEPPIRDLDADLPKLHFRKPRVDREATMRKVQLAGDILGDTLPPRIHSHPWWTSGLTWDAVLLVGLENLMLAMCDQPQGVHRLMAFLRDDHLHFLEWLEREGLLTPNNGSNSIASGGVGHCRELPGEATAEYRPAKLRDLWGFAESQETVGVSPEMFAEFIFPYQLPILERFGLNCYGCCEPVHTRIEHVLKIPRLRRVSVSPWCDQAVMAERLGRKIIFSRKPNPSLVCVGFIEDAIRRDLRSTLEVAGHLPLEIILKDTHTTENQPWRLSRWVEIAYEEISRCLGSSAGLAATEVRSGRP